MGCFGYICKGCGTALRGDEKGILMHIRHGEVVGKTEGHYDGYGRVTEEDGLSETERFRGNCEGINGHNEMCNSDFGKVDSYTELLHDRKLNGEQIDFNGYVSKVIKKELDFYGSDIEYSYLYNHLSVGKKVEIKSFKKKMNDLAKGTIDNSINDTDSKKFLIDFIEMALYSDLMKSVVLYNEFLALPKVELEKYSGIAVWHSLCYQNATEEQRNDLTPSLNDPNQSWGDVRKEFV